jgi:hypothetical protein
VFTKANIIFAALIGVPLAASPAIAMGRCVGCNHADGGGNGGHGAAVNPGDAVAAAFANVKPAFHRGAFFAGLFILGFANGICTQILQAIAEDTVGGAILDTFGISVLVWAACFVALSLLLRHPAEPVTRRDLIVGSGYP